MIQAFLDLVDCAVERIPYAEIVLPILMLIWCTPLLLIFALIGLFMRPSKECDHDWEYYCDAEGGDLSLVQEFKLNSTRVCKLCPCVQTLIVNRHWQDTPEP